MTTPAPGGETCGKCKHQKRCKALIQSLTPESPCDFIPSRFRPASEGVDTIIRRVE